MFSSGFGGILGVTLERYGRRSIVRRLSHRIAVIRRNLRGGWRNGTIDKSIDH